MGNCPPARPFGTGTTTKIIKMLTCPNCGQRSISAWRKQFVGPLRTICCPNCNATISVGWLQSAILNGVLVLFPIILMVLVINKGFVKAAIFALLALPVVGAYQHFLVPLKVRSLPEDG